MLPFVCLIAASCFISLQKDADNALELLAREAVRQPAASMYLIHLHSEQAEGASRLYEALPAHRNKALPRRVVLTTAAAESAFSFDGIVFVIDSGLEMRKVCLLQPSHLPHLFF